MGNLFEQIGVYRDLLRHPLNEGRAMATTRRWLGWHIGSRLVPGPVMVPFVNGTVLLVEPGMRGATQNVYCGLAEPSDMAFVLHALRPSSLFLDIGANVGAYTILASAAVGATTISVEPLPSTFHYLRRNVVVNNLSSTVRLLNVGVREGVGRASFTVDQDIMNHVAVDIDDGSSCEIDLTTIDELLVLQPTPDVIKIDIEGYEMPAFRGAQKTLRQDALKAIVVELAGNGERYGFTDSEVASMLKSFGFVCVNYDPFRRTLTEWDALKEDENRLNMAHNAIFVRDLAALQEQARSRPSYDLNTGKTL